MAKEELIEFEGEVLDNLSNGFFSIELDNGTEVRGHLAGKMRRNNIRILVGDKVKVEMTPYDITVCRITWRYK